ncbi:MAG: alpha/beta hydrolase [Actinomycetota bacterium]
MSLDEALDDASVRAHLRRTADVVGLAIDEIAAPRSRFVRVGDVRYHYLDWETPALPVLFLHGYGLNAHTWDAVALGLSRDYRCLALDQRGHGRSDWGSRSDYTVEARALAADTMLDVVGLDEVALVGHSMGALVGLSLAARLRRRVAALVMVDASPFSSVSRSTGARFRERTFESVDEAFELVRRANPGREPQVLRQNLLFNLRQLPDGEWTWRYDQRQEMLRPEDRGERNRKLIALLPDVTSPTLVVRGIRSEVVEAGPADDFARALPNGRLMEIEDAGHNVQGDNPRRLAEVVSRFFDEISYR